MSKTPSQLQDFGLRARIQNPEAYDHEVSEILPDDPVYNEDCGATANQIEARFEHEGSVGWGFLSLRLGLVTVRIACSDAADEEPLFVLHRFLHALVNERAPARENVDQEGYYVSLGLRRTTDPDIVWLTVGNLIDFHLNFLVRRLVLIEELTAAVQKLDDAEWRRPLR